MEKKNFYTEIGLKGKKNPKPTKNPTNQLKTPRKAGVWGRSYEKEKKINVSVSLEMQG